MRRTLVVIVCLMLAITFILSGCSSKKSDYKKFFYIMGETVEIQIDPDCPNGELILDSCQSVLDELEKELSDERIGNDIYNINEFSRVTVLSLHAQNIIKTALDISELCPGFDITTAPLVDIWDQAQANRYVPNRDEVNEVLKSVGHDKINISNRVVEKFPGVTINLDGIINGYVADTLVDHLKTSGVKYGIVYVGDCAAVFGEMPTDSAFKVAIKNDAEIVGYVYMSEGALCSVQITDDELDIDGKKYCRWISPFDGYPAGFHSPCRQQSITVINPSAAVANALAVDLIVRNIPIKDAHMMSEIEFDYISISDGVVYVSDGIANAFEPLD